LFSVSAYYLFLCGIFFCMYSFDNLSSSLGSISNALALPVSRGRHGKLVDNFSHESDVTSLQDPFTSRPYKTPFYFYYCVPRKIPRGIFFQLHVEYSASSRLLVSAHCSLGHRFEDYVSLSTQFFSKIQVEPVQFDIFKLANNCPKIPTMFFFSTFRLSRLNPRFRNLGLACTTLACSGQSVRVKATHVGD